MAENISFSEENNGKKPNCKLKCLKRASRVNLLDQRLNVDIYSIYIYIDQTCKLYKVKIQQRRRKQTLSCVIEMVLAKTSERNNVH